MAETNSIVDINEEEIQQPTLSQEKTLLEETNEFEHMDQFEEENGPTDKNASADIFLSPENRTNSSIETNQSNGNSDMSSSTGETMASIGKRPKKRLSGAQSKKRRRLLQELKAIAERAEGGALHSRTDDSQMDEDRSKPNGAKTSGVEINDTEESPNGDNSASSPMDVTVQNGKSVIPTTADSAEPNSMPTDTHYKRVGTKDNRNDESADLEEDQKKKKRTRKRKNKKTAGNSSLGEKEGTEKGPSTSTGNNSLTNLTAQMQKKSEKPNFISESEKSRKMQEAPRFGNAEQKPREKEVAFERTVKIDESLRLAIVDANDQTGGLNAAVLDKMEEYLLKALDAHLAKIDETERPPILPWTGTVGSAYRVNCLDKMAADWLYEIVPKPSFCPGQKLCVVTALSLKVRKPKLLKVTVWVPGKAENFEVLTKRIGRLNPSLPTVGWKKFRTDVKEGGQLVTFGMPEEHLAPLEALECTAFSGTKMLFFRVKKNNKEDFETEDENVMETVNDE